MTLWKVYQLWYSTGRLDAYKHFVQKHQVDVEWLKEYIYCAGFMQRE